MLRVTGGEFRGRTIAVPAHYQTRPSQSKLRQALFNSLQTKVPGARVLDLFCGPGTLGLEALSRGASYVVFVESARDVIYFLKKNIFSFGVKDKSAVVSEPLLTARAIELFARWAPYDVILADPPYAEGWEMKLLEHLPFERVLAQDGVFCLEWGAEKSLVDQLPDQIGVLEKVREKAYGNSVLTTYARGSDS